MLVKVLGQAVDVSQIENPTLRSIFTSEARFEQSGPTKNWGNWTQYQNYGDWAKYNDWGQWGESSGLLTSSPNTYEPDVVCVSDSDPTQ